MNEEMKIEDGVPMPSEHPIGMTATLRAMKVGQSFVTKKRADVVHSSAITAFGKSGHVSVRKEGDGTRVWRIK